MYNSISYMEISCKYNKSDLMRFVGALQGRNAHRSIVYRNRTYIIGYDAEDDYFYICNRHGNRFAFIMEDKVKFYVSRAQEIGLELIFGFLALFNIYPVKA